MDLSKLSNNVALCMSSTPSQLLKNVGRKCWKNHPILTDAKLCTAAAISSANRLWDLKKKIFEFNKFSWNYNYI